MSWVSELFNKVLGFLYSLLMTLFDFIHDFFAYIFVTIVDLVGSIVTGAISSLGAISFPASVPLPSGLAWVASQVGLPQILVLVSAALVVRFTLQLIPFVRLGS